MSEETSGAVIRDVPLSAPAAPSVVAEPRDVSDPALLPAESPLPMPPQDFDAPIHPPRRTKSAGSWVPRAAIFAGTALLMVAFGYELYAVLSFVRMTPIQFLFWILSTLSFGWITLGSLSASLGFLPLFAGDSPDNLPIPATPGPVRSRTAVLVPIYNEDPARIAGMIDCLSEEIARTGVGASFDIFVLSDTRDANAGNKEQAVFRTLKHEIEDRCALYYRRRKLNSERKAGNIKDWVERFGAAYAQFLILDADSIMTGEALVRLTNAMEANPAVGLVQTVPRLTGASTRLQKLQQFACNTYGPAVASGIAFWHLDRGNYWGHNAMIRTEAFAGSAGLPTLPGRPPFGGHILSHDFVEAVLLQRAGWSVHMVPGVEGSFEGLPPALIEMVTRDRRWAQGNLQHLAILGASGITTMGRIHMAMGASAYLVSAVWAASLAVGLVLLLQGQQLIPSYFQDSKTLFPVWPEIDPGAALRLFMATMGVVLLPKGLGLVLELRHEYANRDWLSMPRTVIAVATETVASMLIAPIMMMTQTVAVFEILLGRDSGWAPQKRGDSAIPLADCLRYHWLHIATGILLSVVVWNTTPGLAVWMAPVILGLLLSAFTNWFTARPAGFLMRWLLSTREDRQPPPTLANVNDREETWSERVKSGSLPGPGGYAAIPRVA